MADQVTQSNNVLDPQVLADMIPAKLTAGLKFTSVAQVDKTLKGKPGSTIEFPTWNYIGDAEDVKENEPIDTSKLTYGSKPATIKEIGKGGSVTDAALETGYGDAWGELSNQLGLALANKIDNDVLEVLRQSIQKASVDLSLDGIQDALDIYNNEDDASTILIASPKAAGRLRLEAGQNWLRGTQLGADTISKGVYGDILGVQIIRSRKLNADEAFLVKIGAEDGKPAIKLMLKRDIKVEPDRVPKYRRTDVYATAVEAPYLYDPTKVVKITFKGLEGPAGTTGAPSEVSVTTEPDNVKEENKIGTRSKKKSAKNTQDQKQEQNTQDQKQEQDTQDQNADQSAKNSEKKPGEV